MRERRRRRGERAERKGPRRHCMQNDCPRLCASLPVLQLLNSSRAFLIWAALPHLNIIYARGRASTEQKEKQGECYTAHTQHACSIGTDQASGEFKGFIYQRRMGCTAYWLAHVLIIYVNKLTTRPIQYFIYTGLVLVRIFYACSETTIAFAKHNPMDGPAAFE
jgi:hypothetical protein